LHIESLADDCQKSGTARLKGARLFGLRKSRSQF
jgi:hypothetical protein